MPPLALIPAILSTLTPVSAGSTDNDKTGKYFCYQTGEAVQFGHTLGVRPLSKLRESEQKFVIKISPVKRPEWVQAVRKRGSINRVDLPWARQASF